MVKKTYTISGEEEKAVKEKVKEWFSAHDSIGALIKIGTVIFSPDYQTLPVCDSIEQEINYNKAKFNGFPADNHGAFFAADVVIKNKKGEEEKYTVDVSYGFNVVRIWFGEKVLFKAAM